VWQTVAIDVIKSKSFRDELLLKEEIVCFVIIAVKRFRRARLFAENAELRLLKIINRLCIADNS
jgi:hypothetical protein